MRIVRYGSLLVLALMGCADTSPTSDPSPTVEDSADRNETSAAWFEDVADVRGVDFTLETSLGPGYLLPEIVAGGGAAGDFDGDGRVDLYLVQAVGPKGNRLYRNLGDGAFAEITDETGAEDPRYGMGAATGDMDGDGDLDIFVSNLGRNTLLRNDGGFRFTDVTESAGVGDTGFAASATFFDADRDGDLDLFVTNYLDWAEERELDCRRSNGDPDYCPPARYNAPASDLLYLNDGAGRFTDISGSSGIAGTPGTGLGVVAEDFDQDGMVDLFVANDGMPDRLWVNRGDGRFEDLAVRRGCDRDMSGIAKAGMGVTVEDVDDDGDPDLLVCNLGGETDSFYLNEGGRFIDATNRSGIGPATRRYTRFGLGLVDFDNDGRLDLYAANGRVGVGGETPAGDDPYAEPNALLRGDVDGRFTTVEPLGGVVGQSPATSRGAIFLDFDDDGGMDVLVINRDAPARLLRNRVGGRGDWIGLDIRDRSGAPAIGAKARIMLGDRTISRTVRTDSGYLTARDPRLHVGIGSASGVDRVVIEWPDGREVVLPGPEVGVMHRVQPPETSPASGADDVPVPLD